VAPELITGVKIGWPTPWSIQRKCK